MSRTTANLLLLVAGILWGVGFLAQETAMDDIGPFLFMALRFPLAALAILPLAIREARLQSSLSKLELKNWRSMALVGVVFFVGMAMQQVGLLTTSVTNAGVLTGLYVVLVPIIAFIFFKQPQQIIVWPCALAAFIGIWLLGGGGLDKLSLGDWIVIGGAVFAALHVITIGLVVTELRRPAALACIQFAVSGLLSGVGYFVARAFDWAQEPPFALETVTAAAPEILYAAIFAGAIAFTIMAFCQQYTTASSAAILLSSESLFAAIAGAIVLHERLPLLGYVGCVILFLAIVVISLASARAEEDTAASEKNA